MAFDFQKHDAPDIEQWCGSTTRALSEKDRRRFAAVRSRLTLGHGGTTDIANILDGSSHHPEGSKRLQQLPMILRESAFANQEADGRRRKPTPAFRRDDRRTDRRRPRCVTTAVDGCDAPEITDR